MKPQEVTRHEIENLSSVVGFFIIDLENPDKITQTTDFRRIKDHEILLFLRIMRPHTDVACTIEILENRYYTKNVNREHSFCDHYNSSLSHFPFHDSCHVFCIYNKAVSILRQLSPRLIENIVEKKRSRMLECLQIYTANVYWIYLCLEDK